MIFEVMKQIAIIYFGYMITFCGAEWNRLMENPSLFEGDIILNAKQKAALNTYATTSKNSFYNHWPYGQPIPYEFDDKFENSQYHRSKLEAALKDYEKQTCLRFVKRTDPQKQKQFIRFIPGGGCSSSVGMQYSGNYIRLANGCFSHGTLLHEIAHSLGIWHEQNRPDRDKYIKINFENLSCCSSQFRKLSATSIDSLGFPYDYESMMHYGPHAFGNGKGLVIEVLDKTKRIGQRRGFSKIDVAQINKMYKCGETHTTGAPKVTTTTTTSTTIGFCIKHATSGKYLSFGTDRKLYFSKNCYTRFSNMKKLSTVGSSQCADIQGTKNGAYILRGTYCKDEFRTTSNSKLFSIQHVGTSKCIHPLGGSSNPSDGTKAVIHSGCDQSRLRFLIEGSAVVTTKKPVVTRPTKGGFSFRHTSGMCLAINKDKKLIFSVNCDTKFLINTDGRLVATGTKECAYTGGKNSNIPIKFSSTCNENFKKTQISGSNFALQHVQTSKCIHPFGGSSRPREGTLAIIYHSCDGNRLKFKTE